MNITKRNNIVLNILVLLSLLIIQFLWAKPVYAKTGTFYSQLNAAEQQYFRNIDSSSNLKSGGSNTVTFANKVSAIVYQSIANILDAFSNDNVDLFWNKGYTLHTENIGGSYSYSVTPYKEYDWDTGSRREYLGADIAFVDSTVKQLAAQANTKVSTYDKLAYVHDWLIKNNEYNSAAANGGTAYYSSITAVPWTPLSALSSGLQPVCEGYSRAFKLVCDELNIPCIIVYGGNHMWNQVQIDGKWYAVDCTYDDPVIRGVTGNNSGYETKNNFLVGSSTITDLYSGKTFAQEHVLSNYVGPWSQKFAATGLNYPAIESSAYRVGIEPESSFVGVVLNKVKSIKMNYASAIMSLGQQLQLSVIFNPSKSIDRSLSWSSSNNSVVKVDSNGMVTCVGPGNAKITATTADGSNKKAYCYITGPKAASSVSISGAKEIAYGGTIQLFANVKPNNAVNPSVTWSLISGNGIVDSNTGVVTCTGAGDIKVQAITTNGKKGTYTVKGPKAPSSVKVTGPKTIWIWQQIQLSATVNPVNSIQKEVTWSVVSGNGTINPTTGVLTCTGPGTIKVQAITSNGKKGTFYITGPKQPSSVRVTGKKSITLDGTVQLAATVLPDNSVNKEVTWSVEKGNGIVDPVTGLVTCTGAGDIRVRAVTSNGRKGTITIKGPKEPSSVKITGEKNITLDGKVQLYATVSPANAIHKEVTWNVEKGNGIVDPKTGVVTCIGAGDIRVRATTSNGRKGIFTLKGPKEPSSVKITGERNISLDGKVQLYATVNPANAIHKEVTWSIEKGNGTVDPVTGVVTCTGAGDIRVRAITANGRKGIFTIKGPKDPSGVKVTGEKSIALGGKIQLSATISPVNAIHQEVTWSIEKGNGTVDPKTGVVTCTGAGDIKVIAMTLNGKKGSITIRGPRDATGVSVKNSSYTLAVGETCQPIATVSPKDVIHSNVTWSSSDPAIVTVSEDGTITAVAPGKAIVYATAYNGKQGKCTITVN